MIYRYSDLLELLELSHLANMQVALHAIGDEAILQALRVLNKILAQYPKDDHRHGIVHLQVTNIKIIKWLEKLNLYALIQPIFINSDYEFIIDSLGKKRAKTSYLYKTLLENNINVSLGTDSPIEGLNPFNNIYTAITRNDLLNKSLTGLNPSEAIDIYQAIEDYTFSNALLSFEEHKKGKLSPNYFADFIILNQNIFCIEPNQILKTKVLATFVGGKKVY